MSSWICTKCGETASSKCVNQRTVFPTNQMATLIGNSTILRTLSTPEKTEVFYNFTVYDVKQTRLQLMQKLKKEICAYTDELIVSAYCSHNWVLNSETETTCSLDCAHPNLLSEVTEYHWPEPNLESMRDECSYLVRDALDLTKQAMRSVTGREDMDFLDSQFQAVGNYVRDALNKIAKKELLLPYTVYWYPKGSYSSRYKSFNDQTELDIFIEGLMSLGYKGKVHELKQSGFNSTEVSRFGDWSEE